MNCPFLNSSNPHCSYNLNMQHLDEAFDLCTGHYQSCPIYLELTRNELETAGTVAHRPPLVTGTVDK